MSDVSGVVEGFWCGWCDVRPGGAFFCLVMDLGIVERYVNGPLFLVVERGCRRPWTGVPS